MDNLSIGSALGVSILGFLIVFIVLVLLMIIIKIQTGIFKKINAKNDAPTAAASAAPAAAPAKKAEPAPGSCGSIKLNGVSERKAAMAMAIVADEMKTPINELRFISIKEVK